MSFKIKALDQVIEQLGRLPGLGEKTAQRLAFHLLKQPPEAIESLSRSLLEMKATVRNCARCFSYTDQELCFICQDTQRDDTLLCVVEDAADILRLEMAQNFRGRYHVLQGVLSPLDGIGPDQIRVAELIARIDKESISEVLLALDADLEGDTTSMYITKLVKPKGVRVTRIAHGVPIGGNLEYVDSRTLSRALDNRIEM